MTRRQVVLLGATLATTTLSGMCQYVGFQLVAHPGVPAIPLWTLATAIGGLLYSVPLLSIIGAHEAGHMALARRHAIKMSGPYFLPSPFVLPGTLGAFLRVRSEWPTRRAMLEVACAGPIAGFVVACAFMIWGISRSIPSDVAFHAVNRFGEPLAFRLTSYLMFGEARLYWHPTAAAAWIGIVMTMINLLPYGRFDGGHILTAAAGARVAVVASWLVLSLAAFMAFYSMTWFAAFVVMLIAGPWVSYIERREELRGYAPLIYATMLVFVLSATWIR